MGLATPAVGLQVQPLNAPRSSYDAESATAAMIAAFRNGQITTADLIDRATKQPALQQAVADATDPAQIEARKKILLNKAEQEATATLKSKLELQQASQMSKIPVTTRAKLQDLYKANFVPPNVSLSNWDAQSESAVEAAHATLKEWESEANKADTLIKSIKSGSTNVGGIEVAVSKTASEKIADAGAVDYNNAWAVNYNTPAAWVGAGKPKVQTDLYTAPKGSDAIITGKDGQPNVGRIPDAAQTPEAAKALTVERRVAAPDGQTPTITIGSLTPGSALVGKTPEPARKPQSTEKQSSAQYFVSRANSSNDILKKLGEEAFDPASFGTWVQSTLLKGPFQGMKSQEVKRFEVAKEAWLQGLLRMESGAAISQKEQGWYERTFFPIFGDGPEVQQQKAELRNAMEETALLVAGNEELGNKALELQEKNAARFHKDYVSGNIVGTPAFASKMGAKSQPVTLDGKPTTVTKIGNRYAVPTADSLSKTNSTTKLTAPTPR